MGEQVTLYLEYQPAVLVGPRDTSHGFNSAEAGWLEGRLADVLALAPPAKLTMGRRSATNACPNTNATHLSR